MAVKRQEWNEGERGDVTKRDFYFKDRIFKSESEARISVRRPNWSSLKSSKTPLLSEGFFSFHQYLIARSFS